VLGLGDLARAPRFFCRHGRAWWDLRRHSANACALRHPADAFGSSSERTAPAATSDRQCAVSSLPPSQRQREPKRPSILDGWPGAPTAVALGLPIEDVCSREPLRSSPASREPGRDSRAKSRPPGSRGEGFQGSLVGLAPDYIVPANAALRGAQTPSSWRTRSRWNQADRGGEPRLMPLP
jgi:hypothetical protein